MAKLKCGQAGCDRENVDGVGTTLFTTDKGTFCAEHFTPLRHATPWVKGAPGEAAATKPPIDIPKIEDRAGAQL